MLLGHSTSSHEFMSLQSAAFLVACIMSNIRAHMLPSKCGLMCNALAGLSVERSSHEHEPSCNTEIVEGSNRE